MPLEFKILGHYLNALMPFIKAIAKGNDVRQWLNCLHVRANNNHVELVVSDGVVGESRPELFAGVLMPIKV